MNCDTFFLNQVRELTCAESIIQANELLAAGWSLVLVTSTDRGIGVSPHLTYLLGRRGEAVTAGAMTEERWQRMIQEGPADDWETQILAEFNAARQAGLETFRDFVTKRLGLPWQEGPTRRDGVG